MKLSLSTIFPWAKQIKQAQVAAAEAQAERYTKLFELDDVVRKSLILLKPERKE